MVGGGGNTSSNNGSTSISVTIPKAPSASSDINLLGEFYPSETSGFLYEIYFENSSYKSDHKTAKEGKTVTFDKVPYDTYTFYLKIWVDDRMKQELDTIPIKQTVSATDNTVTFSDLKTSTYSQWFFVSNSDQLTEALDKILPETSPYNEGNKAKLCLLKSIEDSRANSIRDYSQIEVVYNGFELEPHLYDITISSGEGGTVTADPEKASEGKTVTLTVEANPHYKFSSISVSKGADAAAGIDKTTVEAGKKYTFSMPDGNVTVSAVFVPLYEINIASTIIGGTVTAKIGTETVTEAAAEDEVTLTITPPSGNILYALTVKDSSDNAVSTTAEVVGTTYTFTMPGGEVSVTADFREHFGSKAPGEVLAVGDIMFNDGSAEGYSDSLTLTTEQTATAIAVIYDVSIGNKGVGLKQGTSKAWAANSTTGYTNSIAGLVCTPSNFGDGYAGDTTVTFTGTTDGSTSLATLKAFVGSDYSETNYPAWYFVENYAANAGLTGTSYADRWYMPNIKELCKLYQAKDTVNSALGKISTATLLATSYYWSSSQSSSPAIRAWDVSFGTGGLAQSYKTYETSVCVVRKFND